MCVCVSGCGSGCDCVCACVCVCVCVLMCVGALTRNYWSIFRAHKAITGTFHTYFLSLAHKHKLIVFTPTLMNFSQTFNGQTTINNTKRETISLHYY
jgi:hypothetical protein